MRGVAFFLFLSLFPFYSRSQTSSFNTLPELLDSLELLMERQNIPGLMLTLVKNDSVLYRGGLGFKDKADSLPVDENTLFRLGSITKSFVALGVLKLVREGKFSLDDKVKKIAPEIDFDNPFEEEHPVLVKHLLSHTAGFDDMHFRELYNITDETEFPLEKVIRLSPPTLHVRWEPGSRFAYSNPGWSLAGFLIEKYSGMKYDDYLATHILAPIGMTGSNFKSVPEGEQYAKGYNAKGEEVPFLPIYHRPAGAFNSNAKDMALWLKFLTGEDTKDSMLIFDEADLGLIETPVYTMANRAGLPVGYALGNYTFDAGLPLQFNGHDGGIDGFISSYGYNREYAVGYAMSNNGSKGMGQLVDLVKSFLSKDIQKEKPVLIPLNLPAIAPFEGLYLFKASRNQLFAFADRLVNTCRVSIENDTVYLKYFMKDPFAVFPVYNGNGDGLLFRGKDDYFPSHLLIEHEGKKILATSGAGNYLEQVNGSGVITRQILFFSSLALLLSSFMASLVFFIFAIRRSLSWLEFAKRVIPTVAAIAIFCIVLGMFNSLNSLWEAATVNSNNLMIYLGSWVVLFCALLSTRFAIMNFKTGKGTAFSIYYILLAAATVMMALFLYDAGWMGLKLWEY